MNRNLVRNRRNGSRRGPMTRRGMTLIEILISIGVLAIGLMGIAILMPLAHHMAREGVMEDAKAAAGMRAYREFRIRGMANPENWVGDVAQPDVNGVNRLRRLSYCLDPLGVSATGVNVFPFGSATGGQIPWMQRITLSANPGGGILGIRRNNQAIIPMTPFQADEVFRVQDDLLFEIPEDDEALSAQQLWLPGGVNGNTLISGQHIPLPDRQVYAKRQAQGRFTWFATLVPDLNVNSDLYRLSIAVTAERDPTQDVSGVPAEGVPGEQLVRVTPFGERLPGQYNVAFGGGDVQLGSASGPPLSSLETGQWLLMAKMENDQFDFRWYRIVATDSGDGPLREVTLHGPDWQVLGNTWWAVLVPRVVAVYEKTIRLESSSLWSSAPVL